MRLLLLVAACLGASAHSLPLNLTDLPANVFNRGIAAKLGQYPYMVFIEPHCNGVIISNFHILTQESCIRKLHSTSKVYAGILKVSDLFVPGAQHKSIRFTEFLRHDYQPSEDYTIGIITLQGPLQFTANVKSIQISSHDAEITDPTKNNGAKVLSVSYGNGFEMGELQVTQNIHLDPSTQCRNDFLDFDGTLGICAGYTEISAGTQLTTADQSAPLLVGNQLVGLAVHRYISKPHYPHELYGGFYVRLAPYCSAIEEAIGQSIGCQRR